MNAVKHAEAGNIIARDTANRQLRAYVGITEASLMTDLALPNIIRIIVTYRNTGVTPAKNVRIAMKSAVTAGKQTTFDQGHFDHELATGSLDMVQGMPALRMNDLDVAHLGGYQAVALGNWTIYVKGIIKYYDAFEAEHTTEFCCYWDGHAMASSPTGNHMT